MAEANISVDMEQLCCSVCLDLLSDPVTIPCGHSYCTTCIRGYWDQAGQQTGCFCPQCRRSFSTRPELNRNTVLAELVEKFRESQRPKMSSSSASPGVVCDVCSSEKQPALRSCLVCLVSYCAFHLQPHFESPAFKKHTLIPACRNLQERICPAHDRLYAFYCHSDQMCVCCLCTVGEHKNHKTVPAEAARSEKVEVLMNWKKMMNQKIQQEEKLCEDLKNAMKNIKSSAQSAGEEIEHMFTELLVSIVGRRSEVMEQLTAQEENELSGAEGVLEQAEMELANLRIRQAKIEQTLQTQDHIEFLQHFLSFTAPSWIGACSSPPPNPKVSFEGVIHSVSKLQKSVEEICTTEISNISEKIVEEVRIFRCGKPRKKTLTPEAPLNPFPEPKTREDFLHYSCYLTLEPTPDHQNLSVCLDYRAVEWVSCDSSLNKWPQVLCREGLTGRCYWEAEWCGSGVCTIGLCTGGQRRMQSLVRGFGQDALSWGLDCFHLTYVFRHNNETVTVPAPKQTTTVGVYLDHRAGTLSFYSISSTMTLLHRVHSNFTEPLYPGFALWANCWQDRPHSNIFYNSPFTSEKGHMSLKLINL